MQKAAKTSAEKEKREAQRAKYGLTSEIIDDFPESACVECFKLSHEQHCRQEIFVTEQAVDFLKGCGITMAPEGERMKPGKVCEII